MQSEAQAALAGGITTVCEMPNTNPPTVTIAALADKVRRAEEVQGLDIRFFFGATDVAHVQTIRELWTSESEEIQRLKARCSGVKLYFDHSTGNQGASVSVIEEAFKVCGELGIQIVAHCEDAQMNHDTADVFRNDESIQPVVRRHSSMRPAESEAKAIQYAIDLARAHDSKIHVAHLSTKQGIDLVRQAKAEGLNVTCEVAPHHLFLTEDDYTTLGTLTKMNPPVRSQDHQEALWNGISDGTVDCISTDHAPHTLEEKTEGEPLSAPSGVPGVETMIPLLLSVASGKNPRPDGRGAKRELRVTDIMRLCFENPNRIFGLGKKGIIEGAPADLTLIDPEAEWMIRGSELHGKTKWTPFEG
jgi:dihydroorotase